MQLANVANLNELGERLLPPSARPFIQVGGRGSAYLAHWASLTAIAQPNFFESTRQARVHYSAQRWLVDSNVILAGGGSTLLGRTEAHVSAPVGGLIADVAQRDIAGAFSSELVPFLAVVQSLVEHDEIAAARNVIDAVPLDLLCQPEMRRLKGLLAPPRVTVSPRRDTDRAREYGWFRDHWQAYRGQWVALEGDRLVASARSLKELRERLMELNPARPPLIHHLQ